MTETVKRIGIFITDGASRRLTKSRNFKPQDQDPRLHRDPNRVLSSDKCCPLSSFLSFCIYNRTKLFQLVDRTRHAENRCKLIASRSGGYRIGRQDVMWIVSMNSYGETPIQATATKRPHFFPRSRWGTRGKRSKDRRNIIDKVLMKANRPNGNITIILRGRIRKPFETGYIGRTNSKNQDHLQ
ncbi:hypothetical protein HZH66_002473 [Vespula vulgaris]|uniref:Uncharacterized protein n=1 Tax=Vespula vulgaris TaxID=7454 RepID=A0A834KL90_VESVU|nr:hypothetical protein HZH66_002473 [Vespula vulgaris]